MEDATIYALGTPTPSRAAPGAISVIRLSGPRAPDALIFLTEPKAFQRGHSARDPALPEPRRMVVRALLDPETGEEIDRGLVVWFEAPNSETGETMAELHLHGGRAVIAALLAALGEIEGLRLAEPGEFTRRAFESGRLDLTAVEGLGDLIFAETEAQRAQALRQYSGALAACVEAWRTRLIEALALVEARIDFSDEADVPEELLAPAIHAARQLIDEIEETLRDERRGERLREGLVVAIAGPPNAGKSSLLNRLAQREAAIVSPYAGTTRDVIEVHLDLAGYPVTLLDTAGIRPSDDPVEQEGVRRAEERAASADLVLWVVDVRDAEEEGSCKANITVKDYFIIHNKVDLFEIKDETTPRPDSRNFAVSAKLGTGIESLIAALAAYAEASLSGAESALVTRERHRIALQDTAAALRRAVAEGPESEDLVAEELRLAARSLGRLTGRVDVEDVLDVIFRDFCIGK